MRLPVAPSGSKLQDPPSSKHSHSWTPGHSFPSCENSAPNAQPTSWASTAPKPTQLQTLGSPFPRPSSVPRRKPLVLPTLLGSRNHGFRSLSPRLQNPLHPPPTPGLCSSPKPRAPTSNVSPQQMPGSTPPVVPRPVYPDPFQRRIAGSARRQTPASHSPSSARTPGSRPPPRALSQCPSGPE